MFIYVVYSSELCVNVVRNFLYMYTSFFQKSWHLTSGIARIFSAFFDSGMS